MGTVAVAAKVIERRVPVHPRLTLVHGARKSAPASKPVAPSKKQTRSAVESAYRDGLRVVVIVLVVGVLIGLGLVWLTTEAARLSKETDIIKQDIKREADNTQQLQMARYQVASAQQIEQVATQLLGMVPVNGDVTVVDVGAADTSVVAAAGTSESDATAAARAVAESPTGWVAQFASGATLSRIAELTSGEAQVLLVGDIGLTAAR